MGERRESELFDNGRRGEPLRFCDCLQCFGMCIADHGMSGRDVYSEKDAPLLDAVDGDGSGD